MKARYIVLAAAAACSISMTWAQSPKVTTQEIPEGFFIRGAEITPNGKYASLNFGMSGSGAWDLTKNEYIPHGTTYVSGITNDGTMVGQLDGMPVIGVEGNWTQLYVNDKMYGMAEAVTPDGRFACGWIDSDIEPGSTQAVVWDTQKNDAYYVLYDIDLSEHGHGVLQSRGLSISDDGKVVVGNFISSSNNDNVAAVWVFNEELNEYEGVDIHTGYLAETYDKGKYRAADGTKVSPNGEWVGGTLYGDILDEQDHVMHLPFGYNLKEKKMYFYIWDKEIDANQLMDIADDGTVYCIGNNYGGVSGSVALYGTPASQQLILLQEHFESIGYPDFPFQENASLPVCVNGNNEHVLICTVDEAYQHHIYSVDFSDASGIGSIRQSEPALHFDYANALLSVNEDVNGETVCVYDLSGRLVKSIALQPGVRHYSLKELQPGVYVVKAGNSTLKIARNIL